MWRFARRRCGSSADADDVTAETFTIAWRRRHDLPAQGERRLWLFGTARKVIANHHRGNTRRARLTERLAKLPVQVTADPAHEVVDRSRDVQGALRSLSPDDREVLILRGWDGLAVREIADLWGCTPNAASLRLHRARGRLREVLAETTNPTAWQRNLDKEPARDGDLT